MNGMPDLRSAHPARRSDRRLVRMAGKSKHGIDDGCQLVEALGEWHGVAGLHHGRCSASCMNCWMGAMTCGNRRLAAASVRPPGIRQCQG